MTYGVNIYGCAQCNVNKYVVNDREDLAHGRATDQHRSKFVLIHFE